MNLLIVSVSSGTVILVKEIWQYLGTCNYQHRFLVNYTTSVEPLLSILKMGGKETRSVKFAGRINAG